jgi:hypothetical protein
MTNEIHVDAFTKEQIDGISVLLARSQELKRLYNEAIFAIDEFVSSVVGEKVCVKSLTLTRENGGTDTFYRAGF